MECFKSFVKLVHRTQETENLNANYADLIDCADFCIFRVQFALTIVQGASD
jgi:hypothetical protein